MTRGGWHERHGQLSAALSNELSAAAGGGVSDDATREGAHKVARLCRVALSRCGDLPDVPRYLHLILEIVVVPLITWPPFPQHWPQDR